MEKSSEKQDRPVAGMGSLALGAFCAFGVFVICIGIGMSSVMFGKKMLLESSSAEPLIMNYDEVSEESYAEALRKITGFTQKARSGDKLEFSLSADEINSLIVYDEQFGKLKGVLKFSIDDSGISSKVSWPLDYIDGLKGEGDGRFLNGEAKFQIFIKKDELRLFLEGFYQQGKKLEVDAINVMQQINLFKYWPQYEAQQKQLALAVESVCIDNKLYFRNWKTPPKVD
jgi:hypothetical protein